MKHAFLVTLSATTRIIADVPNGDTIESFLEKDKNYLELVRVAREKISGNLEDYLAAENADIFPDDECPAGTFSGDCTEPKKESASVITTVEDMCQLVGCSLSSQEKAQAKVESLLSYLSRNGVINGFNEDKLDRLLSDEQSY